MSAKDGGAAFPCLYVSEGMSLRDYFDGQALVGLTMRLADPVPTTEARRSISVLAYAFADTMLKAGKL